MVKTQNLSANDMEVLGMVLQYCVLVISSLSKQQIMKCSGVLMLAFYLNHAELCSVDTLKRFSFL